MPPKSPLDGLRPANTLCERCAYHVSGATIKDGAITCPECGHTNRFDFAGHQRNRRQRRDRLWIIRCLGAALGFTIIAVVFAVAAR